MPWKPIHTSPPPDNAWPLAVVVKFTCDCMRGGKAVFAASREDGVWRIDTGHDLEVIYWQHLDPIPQLSN